MRTSISKVRLFFVLLFVAMSCYEAQAQEEDNSFGGWHFLEVSHSFGNSPWSAMLYFEHENYQYQRLDCWYLRPGVRFRALPWLKLGLSYDYLQLSSTYGHRIVADVVGTLKEDNLTASLRFRYLHTWKPKMGTEDNELRTRLIVSYHIPETRLSPYMAVEVFTWGSAWKRSRHYAACTYDITSHIQVEGFYMLTFSGHTPEHILGLGLNVNI